MKTPFFVQCILLCLLIHAAPRVSAQRAAREPHVVHEQLGEVIDAQENSRYNIFGEIAGFTAARLHRASAQAYELHLLRNFNERGQILILKMAPDIHQRFRKDLGKRVNAVAAGEPAPDHALYLIAETQWRERSVSKKLVLRDGNTLYGTLQSARADTLVVQTASGLLVSIADAQIAKVRQLQGDFREGKYYRTDPNATRLLLAPTGYGLRVREGYFADYMLFFPVLGYGVTDHLALEGGISLILSAYFGSKLTFALSSTARIATGLVIMGFPSDEEPPGASAFGYVVGTFGGPRSAITFGAALPLNPDGKRNPPFFLGGAIQISNSAKLFAENWLLAGERSGLLLFSGGARFFGERMAVDIALVSGAAYFEEFEGGALPLLFPWVGFSVSFGK